MPASTTVTLTYQLNHPAPGTFTNRAQVSAVTTPDPDSVANPANTTCAAQSPQDDCATSVVTVAPRTGTVAGTVWRDTNGNGQRETGEPLQPNVTVRVRASTATGAIVASTVTGTNGAWSAAAIPAGTYVVEVVVTNGAMFTASRQGAVATDSDVDTGGRATVEVVGGATTTVDAGLIRADSPTADRLAAPQGVAVTVNVLDNDRVPGRVAGASLPAGWTWTQVDGPAWGAVTCQANGACTFRATANYAGADRFRYTLTNPLYGPSTVEVAIDVTPVNDPPLARDDRAVAAPGQPVVAAVTNNDEDPNDPAVTGDANRPGDRPRVATTGPVTPAGAGTATCATDSCIFSPAPEFTGVARFTYTIVDGGGLADEASVEMFVDPAPSPAPGFTGQETAALTATTGSWAGTTSAGAAPSCGSGRPRVTVQWQAVDRATGYRIERRSSDADRWVDVAVADSASLTWADDLVGEAQTLQYRVSPLRYRWTGQPSAATSVITPAATGPAGC